MYLKIYRERHRREDVRLLTRNPTFVPIRLAIQVVIVRAIEDMPERGAEGHVRQRREQALRMYVDRRRLYGAVIRVVSEKVDDL